MGYAVALREDVLAWFRGTIFPTVPAHFYVALLTTNPSDDTGTGLVEVSTGVWTNYARQAIANTTAGWSAPGGGTTSPQSISNAAVINFGTATISGGAPVVTGFALYDAVTGGVFWGWAALTTNQTVANSNTVTFPIGDLVLYA